MQNTSDLTAAVGALKQEVSDIAVQMDDNFQKLMTALGSTDQPAIDQAVADIQEQIDALKAVGERDMVPPGP